MDPDLWRTRFVQRTALIRSYCAPGNNHFSASCYFFQRNRDRDVIHLRPTSSQIRQNELANSPEVALAIRN
jgi:hypothetical protein